MRNCEFVAETNAKPFSLKM